MFRQEEMSDSKGILAPSRLGCLLRPLRPSPTGPKRFCQEQVQYQLTIGPRLSPAITSCPGRKLNLQSRLPVVSDFYIFPAWGGCRACGRTAGKSEFARSALESWFGHFIQRAWTAGGLSLGKQCGSSNNSQHPVPLSRRQFPFRKVSEIFQQ